MTSVQTAFAAEENVNEEAVISQKENNVEENYARFNEDLRGKVDANEKIAECEVFEPDVSSMELRAGQTTSLPTYFSDGYISAAITSNGNLYCWGYNEYGQVRNGSTVTQRTTVRVLDFD